MRIAKFVGLSFLATVTMVSTACATGTSSAMASATGTVARKTAQAPVKSTQAPLKSAAMIVARPKRVDVAVAASARGKYDEADAAFMMASGDSSESPLEAAQAWVAHMERRIPTTFGEQGLEDLANAFITGNQLTSRIAQDGTISADLQTAALMKVSGALRAVRDRADYLAGQAVQASRATADRGDNFWTPNDREIIHDALAILAPFSVHSGLLSRTMASEVSKAKAYALSYVSEPEHRMMLINAGHIANER